MENLYTILDKAGFSPSEQRVYVTGLNNSYLSSTTLVQDTRLPRPTVMAALATLREAGMCTVSERDGRSLLYTMQPLSHLKAYLGRKAREVEAIIHEVDALPVKSLPGIQVETGASEELQNFLELALRCTGKQWRIMAPRDNALRHLPAAYVSYFKRVRKVRGISSQTLWEDAYREQTISLMDTLMRKPRYLPKDIAKTIPAIILSFDDSLLFVNGTTTPTCSLITNHEVAASFNILFDLGWRSCREKN